MSDAAALRVQSMERFWVFLQLMNPAYKYAKVHEEFCDYLQASYIDGQDALGLLPRGHLKSHILANFAVWLITKDPTESIVYTCYSSDLAEKQVFAMKQIITSDRYYFLFPDNVQGGKPGDRYCKTLWRKDEFMLDSPILRKLNTREPSVAIGTLNSPKTGFHPTCLMFDDLVVINRKSNYPSAHHEEGRRLTREVVASLNNTLPASGRRFAVGTRYHPDDQYARWLDSKVPEFAVNTAGVKVPVGEKQVWTSFIREVEEDGKFLWPTVEDAQGRRHGFDPEILAGRKAEELDSTGTLEQFWAQYYNRCNHSDTNRINRNNFRYYEKNWLQPNGSRWMVAIPGFNPSVLNIGCAIDFAYSVGRRADSSAIAVVGVDSSSNVFVLELSEYKTEDFNEHVQQLKHLHNRWGFSRVRMEVNGPQKANAGRLQEALRLEKIPVLVDPFQPIEVKEERIAAVLEHRYALGQVYHSKGSLHVAELEDQLEQYKPKRDDLKDALATAVEFVRTPTAMRNTGAKRKKQYSKYGY